MTYFATTRVVISKLHLTLLALTIALLGVTAGAAQAQDISSQTPSRVGEVASYAVKAGKSANADQVLQLDDGSAENAIGFNDDTNNDGTSDQSLGALYFNRFTPPPGDFPLELHDVQIQFGTLDEDGNVADGGLSAGDVIDIYVWSDADGDPTTGAMIEAVLTDQTLGAIDATFQTFAFPSAVQINSPGDVLVGFVNRTLPSTATFPAAIDQTATQGRSWVAAYANGSGSIAPPASPPELPPSGADDVFGIVGDINSSSAGNWMIRGSYDVLTGSESQPLSFAPQIGPTNPFDGITNVDSAPGFADLDGDGDLDMAFVDNSISETFAYYENTGSATNPKYVKRTGSDSPLFGFQVGDPQVPSFADLDGDGDLDMLGGTFDRDAFAYFENIGTPSNPVFIDRGGSLNPLSNVVSDAQVYKNPHFVDFDNDGDFDVAAVRSPFGPRIIENVGSLTNPSFSGFSSDPVSAIGVRDLESVFLKDFDGDQKPDAIVYSSNTFFYFENTGTLSVPSFERRDGIQNPLYGFITTPAFSPGLSAADIDDDGDVDIVRDIADVTPESGLVLFENGGAVSSVHPAPADPFSDIQLSSSETGPTFADLDTDGDLDLILSTNLSNENFSYRENIGSSTNPEFVRRQDAENPFDGLTIPGFNTPLSPELVDIDGDGDLDMVANRPQVSSSNGLFYFQNLGTDQNPIFASRTGTANPFDGLFSSAFRTSTPSPFFIDYDGDNDFDLILSLRRPLSIETIVAYYENTGSRTSPSFVEATGDANPFQGITLSGSNPKPFVFDFDEDGDLDLLSSGGRSNSAFEYFENVGSQSSPYFVRRTDADDPFAFLGGPFPFDPVVSFDCAVADLDGDGDRDFVTVGRALNEFGGTSGNRLVVFTNGSPQPPLPVELTTFTATTSGEAVTLRWETASETNNAGFEVERATGAGAFERIGFEAGAGTTAEAQTYRFNDAAVPYEAEALAYRLKQVDTDGAFEYSPEIEVALPPAQFALELGGANPFRASTTLRYALPEGGPVTLTVYDVLGRRVATLVDREQAAGRYTATFDGSRLASGAYFVRLQSGDRVQTRRVQLVR